MGYYSTLDPHESFLTIRRSEQDTDKLTGQLTELETSIEQLRKMGLPDAVRDLESRASTIRTALDGGVSLSEEELVAIRTALDAGSLSYLGVRVAETGFRFTQGESGKFYYPKRDIEALINAVPGLIYNGMITTMGEDFEGSFRVLIEDNKLTLQVPGGIIWEEARTQNWH